MWSRSFGELCKGEKRRGGEVVRSWNECSRQSDRTNMAYLRTRHHHRSDGEL
jgi:hypothetical protein